MLDSFLLIFYISRNIDRDHLDKGFVFLIDFFCDDNRSCEIREGSSGDTIEFGVVSKDVGGEALIDGRCFNRTFLRIGCRELRLRVDAVCSEESDVEIESL